MKIIKKIIRRILEKIKELLKMTLKLIFFLPIFKIDKKKIIFNNFAGRGFGDNPKYIALELIRQNVNCKMIWLVNNLDEEMPEQIIKVKHNSIRAMYETATAKIWINNVRCDHLAYKKKGQYYIQTWHGDIRIKQIEKEVEQSLTKEYVKEAKYDGKITDLMITGNDNMYNTYRTSFWYNGRIEKIGIPRNDILFNNSSEIINKVYNFFNIQYQKKIVLYAPTFRINNNTDVYKFDYSKIINCLRKKFQDDYILLIRLHPNDIKNANFIKYNNSIINASIYSDVQELILASDILITDYSSLAFDFAMINKKVFLLCKDYQ